MKSLGSAGWDQVRPGVGVGVGVGVRVRDGDRAEPRWRQGTSCMRDRGMGMGRSTLVRTSEKSAHRGSGQRGGY